MSPINFAALAAENPELGLAWAGLSEWFKKHRKVNFIDIRRLSAEMRGVNVVDLAKALHGLVQQGALKQIYRVAAPDGVLIDRDFSSPTEIPERMPDRFHRTTFDFSEGDIVSGFLLENSGVQ